MHKIISLIVLLLFLAFAPQEIGAFEKPFFVTFSNDVVGREGWVQKTQSPLDVPIAVYQESTPSAIPITWMLRYDAINDSTISAFFVSLSQKDPRQKLGLSLELTPRLLQSLSLSIPSTANTRTLNWFTPEKRFQIIDSLFSHFFNRFGYYPSTVSACYLDAKSLNYLASKYSVLASIFCDDQYQEYGDRISGGYLGGSYIPSVNNALRPSQGSKDRIRLVVARLHSSELMNEFGLSGTDDVLKYLSKEGFNEYTNLNLGWSNNLEIRSVQAAVKKVLSSDVLLSSEVRNKSVDLETLGNWVLNRYPETSPVFFYTNKLKDGTSYYLYQNPYYRISMVSNNGSTKIIDFREYSKSLFENDFMTSSVTSYINAEIPGLIDKNKSYSTPQTLDINLQNSKITNSFWRVKFTENNKSLELLPKSIAVSNLNFLDQSANYNINDSIPTIRHIPVVVCLLVFCLSFLVLLLTFGRLTGLSFLIVSTPILLLARDLYSHPFGFGLWGSNTHDAVFHLSIIQKFVQNPFTLDHPQYSGVFLGNYHFVFDYLSSMISKLTTLPVADVYLVVFPLIISGLISIYLVKLLKLWSYSDSAVILSVLFAFLGGSLGFFQTLIQSGNLFGGESAFWSNQGASIFLNPPYALSIMILVVFLYYYEKNSTKSKSSIFLLVAFLGGLLSQTKIYSFLLLVASLFLAGEWFAVISVGLVGVLITLPFVSSSASPFLFSPFWFVKTMFAASDRVPVFRLANAWQVYEDIGAIKKLTLVSFIGLVTFIVGNFGFRVIGVYGMFASKMQKSQKLALFISILGVLIPLIFIQRFNPWNSIQFMYYSLFFFSLFTGQAIIILSSKLKNNMLKLTTLLFVTFFGCITSIGTIQEHLTSVSSARISFAEKQALDSLKRMSKGTVISPVFESTISRYSSPEPLYNFVSTAYISALSNQPEFLSDTVNLDITGINYSERSKLINRFYNTEDPIWAKNFLTENNISYVYETPLKKMKITPESLCLSKIFDSGEINIYKFNCHDQK